jgi:SNF2 family DNA or RNA helicase
MFFFSFKRKRKNYVPYVFQKKVVSKKSHKKSVFIRENRWINDLKKNSNMIFGNKMSRAKVEAQLAMLEKLTALQLSVLMTAAVGGAHLTQTSALAIAEKAGLKNNEGEAITSQQFKLTVDFLARQSFLKDETRAGMSCVEALVEPLCSHFRAKHPKYFKYAIEATRVELPMYPNPRNTYYVDVPNGVREARFMAYEGNFQQFYRVVNELTRMYNSGFVFSEFIDRFFAFGNDSLNWALLREIHPEISFMALNSAMMRNLWKGKNVDEYENFIVENFDKGQPSQQKGLIEALKLSALFKGDTAKFKKYNDLYTEQNAADALNGRSILRFLADDTEGSLSDLELRLKKTRSEVGVKKAFIDGNAGLFAMAALLKSGKPEALNRIPQYVALINASNPHYKTYQYMMATHHYLQNRKRQAQEILAAYQPTQSFERVFWGCAVIWCEVLVDKKTWEIYEDYYEDAVKAGFEWLAMEYAAIIAEGLQNVNEEKAGEYLTIWEHFEAKLGVKSVMHSVPKFETWQLQLQALSTIAAGPNTEGSKKKVVGDSRVVYMVSPNPAIIQPKEQTLNKNGTWSAGRNVALKRFKQIDVPNMTPQDIKVAATVQLYAGGWGADTAEMDLEKAFPLLVGHPYLFLLDNPNVSFELTERKPELIVEEKGGNYEISFPHKVSMTGINVLKETPTRYAVMKIEQKHVDIINALGGKSLKIPKAAEAQLAEIVGRLSAVITVQSTLLEHNTDVEKVKGDATIHVHLLPIGEGMKVEFYVKPFNSAPPFVKPAKGSTNLMAEIGGVRKAAIRDLKLEKRNAEAVENALQSLGKFEAYEQEWLVETPDDCLQVLLELRKLTVNNAASIPEKTEEKKPLAKPKKAKKGADTEGSPSTDLADNGLPKVIVEWPKGERFKILKQLGFDNMSLRVSKKNDWFSLEGEIKVSEDRVLSMKTLMELMLTAKSNGQFIELGDGQFLALTKQLSKKLKALSDYADPQKDGSLRFHPLAAGAIDDFTSEIDQLEADKHWKAHLKKLKNLSTIQAELPTTFNAELRPYQLEGYRWLMRLADWGVGACLADDMGLGKTVQALAMLTARAESGAALVLAPVSVCRNWEREARRFAPTLNPVIFRDGDRAEMVKNLQPFDVLICTYDLMQREAEILKGVKFSTIILDEAQAIKNYTTKRTKAAMDLQGDFKVITTGTPVENHLGELWSLYNFINPGLLGSIGHFQEKFGVPIDKNGDRDKKTHLRKLIQPFILRRKKNDVLDDLPAKTEITLSVSLSEGERAFYETLRRNAVESLERMKDTGDGSTQLKILAELMRLRRACCNPNLVSPELGLKSSKLELFGEVVEELLENGHKALVFSQFVGHLGLIKEWIESKGIKYQYLAGSTTPQKREEAIAAFQSGRGGDLFLISLKAGGTGLNLTAADYVIHTDPWWNPAVEDQASDRAHRIGQTRPVTIYRLITENTIEEKILNLHAHKRDLADSLLEGSDASAKMTSADLLALMKSA